MDAEDDLSEIAAAFGSTAAMSPRSAAATSPKSSLPAVSLTARPAGAAGVSCDGQPSSVIVTATAGQNHHREPLKTRTPRPLRASRPLRAPGRAPYPRWRTAPARLMPPCRAPGGAGPDGPPGTPVPRPPRCRRLRSRLFPSFPVPFPVPRDAGRGEFRRVLRAGNIACSRSPCVPAVRNSRDAVPCAWPAVLRLGSRSPGRPGPPPRPRRWRRRPRDWPLALIAPGTPWRGRPGR